MPPEQRATTRPLAFIKPMLPTLVAAPQSLDRQDGLNLQSGSRCPLTGYRHHRFADRKPWTSTCIEGHL